MRLRRKITAAFFLVSTAVSVLLALFLYRFIERQLESELKARLADIAQLGAHTVDPGAFARLHAQIGQGADADAIEHSPDYATLSRELNAVRDAEKDLIKYVYILVPTDDPDNPRFVADADVLDLDAAGASEDEISHFDKPYDVSAVPTLKQALATCQPMVEKDFVYDPDFHVNSVSGYYPLTDDQGHCLGVIGVDITDKDMRAALDKAGRLAIEISIAVIVLALLVSVVMGTVLTRSLLSLSATVKKFADKDFRARTQVASKDEIGQLGANFNQMAETIQQHSENLEGLVQQRTSELYAEKQTSERLLLNVLPAAIAQRLKDGEGVIVDRFDEVTVLFADIVGFTSMSAKMAPEKVVTMLDDLFSMFDRLAEVHQLEKIKTIGDAYMVVSGIPQPRVDHARAIARMALDMNRSLAEYAVAHHHELSIRIGIATGSVVAGVIGKKKFIYDLWGDTVNTASRMESHGVPGRVHVTHAAYEALRGEFELESRGVIDVKGKGPMETYLIVGEKTSTQAA